MIRIICELNELWGIYKKEQSKEILRRQRGLPKYRIFSKKFHTKNKDIPDDDYRIYRVKKSQQGSNQENHQFGEDTVIDVVKDRQLWEEYQSDGSLEDYMGGEMKIKY